ncbi:YbjN domain-containing protein [Phreatobacter sp. HK31-P]
MKRPPAFASLAVAVALLAGVSMASGALAQKRPPRSQMQGETIARIFPGQMAALLRDRGNPAEVVTENNRTRIRTEIGNRRSSIYFYACNDDGCQSIQYRTLFQRHERFTLAFVNAWNFEKRFAKAYLDRDGDLVLEWDVDLDGGVSVAFVAESIATFQTMLANFDRFTPRDHGAPGGGNTGRSLTPGRPPADPGQSGTGGKGSTGDVPGERRT